MGTEAGWVVVGLRGGGLDGGQAAWRNAAWWSGCVVVELHGGALHGDKLRSAVLNVPNTHNAWGCVQQDAS